MYLEEVVIRNFCSCEHVELNLARFNPIIGYNNCGKSNILKAVSWLLRKSVLPLHTFHDATIPVTVEGVISEVNLNLLPANQQASLAPFLDGQKLRFRRRQDSPSVPATQVRVEVFNSANGQWQANPVGLDAAIGVLFPDPLYIEAMDDAADDVSKFAAKNTIGLLLKLAIDQVRANNAAALAQIEADLNVIGAHFNGANRLPELATLEQDGTAAIANFFPGLSLHLDILPPALEDLIKGATISLSDVGGHRRPFTSFGHGAQRAVQMALIKLLAGLLSAANPEGATTVLLIDEPELYLHPQAIETLRDSLKLLSNQNFQIIFSTHSPLFLGEDVLNTGMIFKDANGKTGVRQKLATAAATIAQNPHQASVIFSIQNATYLLFSEHVTLVEGKTEMMLVPDLCRIVRGESLAQQKACIVEAQSSSSISPMMQVLRAVGFSPKAVVDLDYVFKVAPAAGFVDALSQDFVACKGWFANNGGVLGFYLGDDGCPTKRTAANEFSAVRPEAAFALMAAANVDAVARLCDHMQTQGIWVWRRGAVEAHLGIAKNDGARMGFLQALKANGNADHAAHADDVGAFVAWL